MANSTMATKEYLLAVVSAVLSGKEIPDLPQDVDVTQFVRLAFTNAVQGIVFRPSQKTPELCPKRCLHGSKNRFRPAFCATRRRRRCFRFCANS